MGWDALMQDEIKLLKLRVDAIEKQLRFSTARKIGPSPSPDSPSPYDLDAVARLRKLKK